ncbi:MAG: hypothetical protein AAGG11_02285, partial [Pseudomonadota bacterium]
MTQVSEDTVSEQHQPAPQQSVQEHTADQPPVDPSAATVATVTSAAPANASPTRSPLEGGVFDADQPRTGWQNLHGSAAALALTRTASQCGQLFVVLTATTADAEQLRRELAFFAPETLPILTLPDWETLPYDAFSPHPDIVSERLATLHQLPRQQHGILVVPLATACRRLTPVAFVASQALSLARGAVFDLAAERKRLDAAGYS